MCGHHTAGPYITMWSGGGGRAMNILPPPWHATTTTTHGEENCPETFHIYFRVISVVNKMFFPSDRKQCEEILKWLLLYDLKPCGWDAGRREQTEPQMRTVTLRTLTMAGRSISEIFNNEYNGRGWIWIRG